MKGKIPVTKKALVTIYTRPGCHLCDDAKANILAAGCSDDFTIEEINIDEDPALKARYQYDIPVIMINGVKVFKYHVDPKEFRRKLKRIARV
jgi:glutaredoxin